MMLKCQKVVDFTVKMALKICAAQKLADFRLKTEISTKLEGTC